MSDSGKNRNIYFLKNKEDPHLILVAKSEKTLKKNFLHQPVLVRNGFPNKGPFAEVESTIRPLPLARLIKSAVAPLLDILQNHGERVTTLTKQIHIDALGCSHVIITPLIQIYDPVK